MVVLVRSERKVIKPSLIFKHTQDIFEAAHKGYTIRIDRNEKRLNSWYAWVTHPDGTYVVDGYFDRETRLEVIQMCMENIYWKPKRVINYVPQLESHGCAIACVAMILDLPYKIVRSMLPANRGFGDRNGMTDHDYISFMFRQGYIGMTVHAYESHTQIKRSPAEWIKPLAELNIVSVINEHGPHAILWVDGKIYDPNDLRNDLRIEGYNVQGITGFWKLSNFKA